MDLLLHTLQRPPTVVSNSAGSFKIYSDVQVTYFIGEIIIFFSSPCVTLRAPYPFEYFKQNTSFVKVSAAIIIDS